MKRDLRRTAPITSSFLSCEKDTETILKKLFIENQPYSDILKRLLVINTKDCLDDTTNQAYIDKINSMSLAKLKEEEYIRLTPKLQMDEHEEVKSYILISFDNFSPNATNPEFRDFTVTFDIICHTDCWDIGNYRLRPLKIAGYIDGILNGCKLSGIGTFNFLGGREIVLNPEMNGYTLMYSAVHGSDDQIPGDE